MAIPKIQAISQIPLAVPNRNDPQNPLSIDYPSYLDVASADLILRIDPVRWGVWNSVDDDLKNEFLLASTNRIDRHKFLGEKVDKDQDLEFPRSGICIDGEVLPEFPLPKNLIIAVAKFAVTIAQNPEAFGIPNRAVSDNVQREQVGPLSTTYFHPESLDPPIENLSAVDNEVYKLLLPLIDSGAGIQLSDSGNTDGGSRDWYETDWRTAQEGGS